MQDTLRTKNKLFTAKTFYLMLEKIRRKLKANYIIAGHTHQYHFNNKDKVLNSGSFGYYSNKIIIGNTLIISDIHLGANDILETTKYDFNKILKNPKYKKIIIVGDFLDLWLYNGSLITIKFFKTFYLLNKVKKKIVWVIGNHDNDYLEYPNIIKATKNIKIYQDIYLDVIKGKKYAFIHGHQYDATNNTFLIRLFYYIWLQIGDNLYFIGDILKPLALKIYKLFKRK